MKKYILIAGVNGAGKSTLYQSLQSLFIELHYIGVEGTDIAKKRVVARVKQGGHGIAEKDIERRYIETFNNLKTYPDTLYALPYVQEATA